MTEEAANPAKPNLRLVPQTPSPVSAENSVPTQAEMPFAVVEGEPITELPRDLYIPPYALSVFLEAFEGPLDLLLYLIRRQNLDILDIPIAEITRQYTKYIEVMTELQLELAGESLVMAATPSTMLELGTPLPAFQLKTFNDVTVSSADLAGAPGVSAYVVPGFSPARSVLEQRLAQCASLHLPCRALRQHRQEVDVLGHLVVRKRLLHVHAQVALRRGHALAQRHHRGHHFAPHLVRPNRIQSASRPRAPASASQGQMSVAAEFYARELDHRWPFAGEHPKASRESNRGEGNGEDHPSPQMEQPENLARRKFVRAPQGQGFACDAGHVSAQRRRRLW